MEKKKTIGMNPLEAYLSNAEQPESESENKSLNQEVSPAIAKQRITIHIPIDLIDKVKNAVFWEPGLTLTGFAQEAFERELKRLESEKGAPYPGRKEKLLKSGRPVG